MTRNAEQTATTDEGSFLLSPTALYRMETGPLAVSAATLPTPYGDALLVFRSEADALAFRDGSEKYPASEGWRPLDLDPDLLAAVLDMHGLGHVVMPHEWTGAGRSDLFAAANFLELLDASPPA